MHSWPFWLPVLTAGGWTSGPRPMAVTISALSPVTATVLGASAACVLLRLEPAQTRAPLQPVSLTPSAWEQVSHCGATAGPTTLLILSRGQQMIPALGAAF